VHSGEPKDHGVCAQDDRRLVFFKVSTHRPYLFVDSGGRRYDAALIGKGESEYH